MHLGIIELIFLAIGLVVVGVVALRPRLFWPVLIIVTVATSGLMVQGHAIVEEYLTGCILIAVFLAMSIGVVRLRRKPMDSLSYAHMLIFSLMIIYLIVESLRGFLLWGDLRLARWIIYYAMIGILSFILTTGNFPVPNLKKMSLIIVWSALLYYVVYLGQGFYAEIFKGVSKFANQGISWSGSAYAVFPLIVAVPAALFLCKYGSRGQRWIGWALFIVTLIVGWYYDSRAGIIGVVAFLIISPTVLKPYQTAIWLLVLAGLFFFAFGYNMNAIERFSQSAVLQYPSEAGRLTMVEAAINSLRSDWTPLLFGYGINSNHYVVGPYLQQLGYFSSGPVPPYVNISGVSLLVDIGLVGILLLFSNFLFIALKVLGVKRSPGRIVLLLVLSMLFVWPVICDINDILLLYLMIMPSGLLVRLSRREPANEMALEAAQPLYGHDKIFSTG